MIMTRSLPLISTLRIFCAMVLLGSSRTSAAAFSASTPRKKLALITGGNKGIGKEIARRIGMEPDFTAIIACRNVELGRQAAKDLAENSSCACDAVALPIPLDLADPKSIAVAAKWVEEEYDNNNNNDNGQKEGGGGGAILDVLVNNAAVCFNDPTLYGRVEYAPFEQQADVTIRTNYFGALDVTRSFLPLLKRSPSPRIINVASAAGRLTILRSQKLVDTFTSEELTMPELSKLMTQFIKDVNDGTHAEKGWPNTCYGVSKVGVIAMTRVLAREHPEMMINSVDPGYCKTDQNNDQGVVDPADGAYTPYLLARMAERENEGGGVEGENESPAGAKADSGLHFYQGSEMPWSYQR